MEAIHITIRPEFAPCASVTVEKSGGKANASVTPTTNARDSALPALAVHAAQAALDVTSRNRSEPTTEPPSGTRWVRCYNPLRTSWQWKPIDVGIADLVEQLQRCHGGEWPLEPTVASCHGHREGERPHVLLADGRVIVVYESMDHCPSSLGSSLEPSCLPPMQKHRSHKEPAQPSKLPAAASRCLPAQEAGVGVACAMI